jgi:hypothetical protein
MQAIPRGGACFRTTEEIRIMNRFFGGLTLLAMAAASGAAWSGQPVGSVETDSQTITVEGNGQQRTFPCNGRKVIVQGTRNVVTLTGVCSGLELDGVDNTVSITLAPNARLEVAGTGQTVQWASSGEPRKSVSGIGNKISRVKTLP